MKECIDKLNDYHTFGEFEKNFFTKKGEDRLNKELNSGWYINSELQDVSQQRELLENFADWMDKNVNFDGIRQNEIDSYLKEKEIL